MTLPRSLKTALAASVCILPLQALAQNAPSSETGGLPAAGPPPAPAAGAPAAPVTGFIDGGGQYRTGTSVYLGQYSGTVNNGLYGLGDFQLGHHDAWLELDSLPRCSEG